MIVHIINGIEYVLFSCPVFNKTAKQFERMVKHYKGIELSCKPVISFWATTYAQCDFLIPSEHARTFSEDSISNY